jgi:hypothetical protein
VLFLFDHCNKARSENDGMIMHYSGLPILLFQKLKELPEIFSEAYSFCRQGQSR